MKSNDCVERKCKKKKLFSIRFALTIFATTCFAFFAVADDDEVTIIAIEFDSMVEGEVQEVPQGGGDRSLLIDGVTFMDKGVVTYATKGIVLVKNTRCTEEGVYPLYSYILELSESAEVTAVMIATYEEYSSMIGLTKGNKVAIESSADGEDFTLVGDYTFEGEAEAAEKAPNVYNIDLGKTVTARYIKLTFQYDDSPFDTDGKIIWEWHGFTEFGVTATSASIIDISEDESSEEATSEEESEEPADESSQETSSGTTPTGDSGMVALAIISVIALAGAVIVKKR